jgi:hypothetical protein
MNWDTLMVSMEGDAIVVTTDHVHPEPLPRVGDVVRPWGACTIPGCKHGPCPAKLRAWGRYGQRYICAESGCEHVDCAPKRRAEEDQQPFGVPYHGPALPQHVVDIDGEPLGPSMRAVQDAEGNWRLAARDHGQ